jgi:hypothetical protein
MPGAKFFSVTRYIPRAQFVALFVNEKNFDKANFITAGRSRRARHRAPAAFAEINTMARERKAWRDWYNRTDWLRKRALQLKREPLCQGLRCQALGKLTPARIVDHIEPHHGDFTAFMHGALQSLCDSCHAHKWADDRRGFGTAVDVTGRPIDPRHPANAVRIYPTDLPPDAPASPLGEDDGKPAITERARKR